MLPVVNVFLALSLDGYIAGPNDDLTWLEPFSHEDPEDTGYAQLMRDVDTIVLGRRTYEIATGFEPWPYAGKRVVVLSNQPVDSPHEVHRYSGRLHPVLAALYVTGTRRVYLDGGHAVRQGLTEDLVDTMTLSFVPVLLGSGIRLFEPGLPLSRWSTRASTTLPSGLVQATYDGRAGLTRSGPAAPAF